MVHKYDKNVDHGKQMTNSRRCGCQPCEWPRVMIWGPSRPPRSQITLLSLLPTLRTGACVRIRNIFTLTTRAALFVPCLTIPPLTWSGFSEVCQTLCLPHTPLPLRFHNDLSSSVDSDIKDAYSLSGHSLPLKGGGSLWPPWPSLGEQKNAVWAGWGPCLWGTPGTLHM